MLAQKLRSVAAYYAERGDVFDAATLARALEDFRSAVAVIRPYLLPTCGPALLQRSHFETVIFEGSQGILLDQEFGYFPLVTRAHTTSRNALELIGEWGLPAPRVHYVTRCYQTRHGNGPLTNEALPGPALRPTPEETNVYNPWQGEQRRTLLDVNQLRYALECDAQYSGGLARRLVVSCLDQLTGPWQVTVDGRVRTLEGVEELGELVGVKCRQLDYFREQVGV